MAYPTITIHDAATGETVEREMTEKEYADYLSTLPTQEETPTE